MRLDESVGRGRRRRGAPAAGGRRTCSPTPSSSRRSAGRSTVTLDATGGQARLQVSDTGIGIDPAFLPHVFNRFTQEDSSSTRSHGGLGLGLAIVRHLVELHGGTVEAESPGIGQGATFSVTLPLASSQREAVDERADPVVGGGRPSSAGLGHNRRWRTCRVLVVDDDLGDAGGRRRDAGRGWAPTCGWRQLGRRGHDRRPTSCGRRCSCVTSRCPARTDTPSFAS